jgi:ribonucleoside-diphosphate reductase alpha chain
LDVKEWLGENNKLGLDIWNKKYKYQDETFDTWLDRVSNGNMAVRKLILEKKFLFGGRILSNRGLQEKGKKVTYSNCFNLGEPEDTIEGIFDIATKMARTYSMGGGCGVNLGKLRPNKSAVNNNAKTSTGVVPFMDLYSKVTETIGQSGRRGALMICLPSHHPDIEEFINSKTNLNKITSANISVWADDSFMRAAQADDDYDLYFFVEQTGETITKKVKARELLRKISERAWDNGEPGMLFKDTIKGYNLMETIPEFQITGTNPCGELPLPSMGCCLLGSINLSEYVLNPYTERAFFNIEEFKKDVAICVTALNDCLEENVYPLPEQTESVKQFRPIGLGLMGLGDLFVKMNVRYGSTHSIGISKVIAKAMAKAAIISSSKYPVKPKTAEMRRVLNSCYYNNVFDSNDGGLVPSNCQLLTIAPTGTISTMMGISGGVEPIFSVCTERQTKSLNEGEESSYSITAKVVEEWMVANNTKEIPDWIMSSTAENVSGEERIAFQAAWQTYIDNAISSTVNLPNSATVEDVMSVFLDAWQNGCKGITVFRAGCSRGAILTVKEEKPKKSLVTDEDWNETEIQTTTPKRGPNGEALLPREELDDWDYEDSQEDYFVWGETIEPSDNLIGIKRKIVSGCGNIHAQFFFDWEGNFREIYLDKGSTGGCAAFMGALSRMTSIGARTGVSLDKIVDQLNSVFPCPSYVTRTAVKGDTNRGKNCPNAIGNALLDAKKEVDAILCLDGNKVEKRMPKEDLEEYKENREKLPEKTEDELTEAKVCPVCYRQGFIESLNASGGCFSCIKCGYSRCD